MDILEDVLDRLTRPDLATREQSVDLAVRATDDVRSVFGEERLRELLDEMVGAIRAGTPFLLSCGNWMAQHQNFELALDCYEAEVRSATPDLEVLGQVGRFLLAQADTPIHPLAPDDFEEDLEVEIYADVPFALPGPFGFPTAYQPQLIGLSTEAFARAAVQSTLVSDDPPSGRT